MARPWVYLCLGPSCHLFASEWRVGSGGPPLWCWVLCPGLSSPQPAGDARLVSVGAWRQPSSATLLGFPVCKSGGNHTYPGALLWGLNEKVSADAFIHSCVFPYSLTRTLTHSRIHIHSFIHALNHSFIHTHTHSFIHTPNHSSVRLHTPCIHSVIPCLPLFFSAAPQGMRDLTSPTRDQTRAP